MGIKKTGLYRLLSLDIAPFPSIIVQATGQKAEAGTLLEEFLWCNVLVKKISQSSEWGVCVTSG